MSSLKWHFSFTSRKGCSSNSFQVARLDSDKKHYRQFITQLFCVRNGYADRRYVVQLIDTCKQQASSSTMSRRPACGGANVCGARGAQVNFAAPLHAQPPVPERACRWRKKSIIHQWCSHCLIVGEGQYGERGRASLYGVGAKPQLQMRFSCFTEILGSVAQHEVIFSCSKMPSGAAAPSPLPPPPFGLGHINRS